MRPRLDRDQHVHDQGRVTALPVIVEVPKDAPYQAAVALRVGTERPQIRYVKPGERIQLWIEDGAHLDIGKAALPCR